MIDLVARQLELQRRTYKLDPPSLVGDARATYIRDNVLAATEELHEYMRCWEWKPWHRGRVGYAGAREEHGARVTELADVGIFLLNLAALEGISEEQLRAEIHRKQSYNEERHGLHVE